MSECRVLDEGQGRRYHCGRCPYEDECDFFQATYAADEHEGRYEDERPLADVDQGNPVDCSCDSWLAIYAANYDLL